MKKFFTCIFILFILVIQAQEDRIQKIKTNINALIVDVPGLSQKVNINVRETTLASFLSAISEVHKINISVDTSLESSSIINNFSDVTVADLLIFLCKEYDLKAEIIGNIIAIKRFEKPIETPVKKQIEATYAINENLISLDLKDDNLYEVFKAITNISGKNLVFSPGLENKLLTIYIKNTPFDDALNKLAFANNLNVAKTKDRFYLFEAAEESNMVTVQNQDGTSSQRALKPVKPRKSNFFFKIINMKKALIEVDFENVSIANIINDIGNELNLDFFVSTPLESAGKATVKAKSITFDALLDKIFESQSNASTPKNTSQNGYGGDNKVESSDSFSYFKNNNIYFFGLKSQLAIRDVKSIQLMHRSIEILGDPVQSGRSSGRLNNQYSNSNYGGSYGNNSNPYNNNTYNTGSNTSNSNSNSAYTNSQTASESAAKPSADILSIVPNEIKAGLDIRVDTELNSFIVSGPAENINRFESFIKYIDKDIPVILIEVMLLEVSRSATVETGITSGIGEKPVTTKGTVFPSTDVTYGAETINNIINHFDGFGSLNIGKVVPNFYLSLKALEANGNVNIRSTPRLSTLNGHKAYLSIGETTYYVVTNQNFYGSQIPQASEIKNYQPIDAELSLAIRPLVSGNGEITMDIKVIQSSFNGQKVDKNAPPGINSREFTSIIRVKDQDVVVLGGLEEKVRNDTGTGVPLLSRVPGLKWLFSSRKREDSKKKLSVLIKPTVIY
jgi:type IV pilus assembly protein PilQ